MKVISPNALDSTLRALSNAAATVVTSPEHGEQPGQLEMVLPVFFGAIFEL